MPAFDCTTQAGLGAIARSGSCVKKVKVQQMAWGRVGELDLDAITDTVGVKGATVNGLPMLAGGVMYPIALDSEKVSFSSQYTSDSGYYTWSITFDLGGFDAERMACFCEAEVLCDIFIWIRLSDCKEVLMGFSKIGNTYTANYRGEITDHTVSGGGDSDSVNSLTISGKSDCALLCTDVGYDNLPLAAS